MVGKEGKAQLVSEIMDMLSSSNIIIATNYSGLKTSEIIDLRRKLREQRAEYKVVKNNLARLALTSMGKKSSDELFTGPTALVFGYGEPVSSAKTLFDWRQSMRGDLPKVRWGMLDGKLLTEEDILELVKLPPKNELLGKLMGSMRLPVSNLLFVLNCCLQKLVGVLQARLDQIKEDKMAGEGAVAPEKRTLSKEEIVEAIKQMTVLELSQLVKALEEEFGVSAVAPAAPAAAPSVAPAEEEAPEEEQTEFSVVLTSFGDKKVNVIKAVREVTSLQLKEAKEAVEAAPKTILEGVSKEVATEAKRKIEEAGGTVEVK